MSANAYCHILLLLSSLFFSVGLFLYFKGVVQDLLDETIGIPSATVFYLRTLFLILLFPSISAGIGATFELTPGTRAILYVWQFTKEFSDVLEAVGWPIIIYFAVITLIVVVLRKSNAK